MSQQARGNENENETHKGRAIAQVCSPQPVDLGLILARHHLLDARRRDGVSEMSEHERDGERGLWRDEDLQGVMPFSIVEEVTPRRM
jgi:hypothetical protein